MKTSCAAVAAIMSWYLPGPAAANPSDKREAVAIRVSAEGLDLATRAGLSTLQRRTARAIAVACNPGERLKTRYGPDWQCRNELGDAAAVKLSALADRLVPR